MNTRFLLTFRRFAGSFLLLAAFYAESLHLCGQAKPKGKNPAPGPAIKAILATFNTYEVVGMSEAHRNKDEDDFILTLIRTPPVTLHSNHGFWSEGHRDVLKSRIGRRVLYSNRGRSAGGLTTS